MIVETAFQRNAFQNDAFQIEDIYSGPKPRKQRAKRFELDIPVVGIPWQKLVITMDAFGYYSITLEESIPVRGLYTKRLHESITVIGEKRLRLILELLRS